MMSNLLKTKTMTQEEEEEDANCFFVYLVQVMDPIGPELTSRFVLL
jgi:hypothetical protein